MRPGDDGAAVHPGGPTDEQLLRMLREVGELDDAIEEATQEAEEEHGQEFDPCPFCGEPAQHRSTCTVCETEGCLPPDLWSPGMRDPCLTLCVRCAREIHLACSAEDEAGNPRCPTCAF
jgi:hypothetical protein